MVLFKDGVTQDIHFHLGTDQNNGINVHSVLRFDDLFIRTNPAIMLISSIPLKMSYIEKGFFWYERGVMVF